MVIIEFNSADGKFHHFQSQSHRTKCWLDGYIEVPKELEKKVYEGKGYCELVIDNNVLVNVIPHPEWIPKLSIHESNIEITAQDDTDAMLIDHEYRLTVLELGVNE